MQVLKLNFVDFWPNFDKIDNHFYKWLSTKYCVEISDTPEIIFFSSFGSKYLDFNCIRIFYTGENMRPDFTCCDYALTFDFNDSSNHLRLPLYGLNFTADQVKKDDITNPEYFLKTKNKDELLEIWGSKRKFCCLLFSNKLAYKRIHFFSKLHKFKAVDSGGKLLNNIGYQVDNKLLFYSEYRFVISFENESHPGYTTEKIMDALVAGCIPIYWGNPLIAKDFNTKRFINLADFKSDADAIERILEIENNPSIAVDILSQPIFTDNKIPPWIDDKNILAFLDKIIAEKDIKIPVAITYNRYLHHFLRTMRKTFYYLKIITKIIKMKIQFGLLRIKA